LPSCAAGEVINITTDLDGGFEPPELNSILAAEVIRMHEVFRTTVGKRENPANLNNAFFHWQRRVFEERGNTTLALGKPSRDISPLPEENSTWPEMQDLPQYQRIRKIVMEMAKRYQRRAGVPVDVVKKRRYSLFNWWAVHFPGEFHAAHTHLGEYSVGVYYAQAEQRSGKIVFTDPRGIQIPFGQTWEIRPRVGQLVLFPPWINHEVTNSEESAGDPKRVALSINVGDWSGLIPCQDALHDDFARSEVTYSEAIDIPPPARAEL
jgi:hypothetical protein